MRERLRPNGIAMCHVGAVNTSADVIDILTDMLILRGPPGSEMNGSWEFIYTLKEAQFVIEKWGKHYNTKRPHGAEPPPAGAGTRWTKGQSCTCNQNEPVDRG